MVIFIIVLGILGTGILMSFVVSLAKTPDIKRVSRATELAQDRMEFILGQKNLVGFSTMADLCESTVPDICTTPALPANYQIDSTIAAWGTDTSEITVTVTNTLDSTVLSSLHAIVADY